MPSSLAEAYASLGRALGAVGTRWYVFGAQAAILHGAVRFTEDIDVTVDATVLTTADLVEALKREGIDLRVAADVENFVAKTRVLPMLHRASQTPVDVVLSGPGIEELFFEHVVTLDVEGVCIPVAASEDVVVMKILAARPKDIEDVVAILAAQGSKIALSKIRDLLTLIEQALDQRDLLPAFEAALGRARRAKPTRTQTS